MGGLVFGSTSSKGSNAGGLKQQLNPRQLSIFKIHSL